MKALIVGGEPEPVELCSEGGGKKGWRRDHTCLHEQGIPHLPADSVKACGNLLPLYSNSAEHTLSMCSFFRCL